MNEHVVYWAMLLARDVDTCERLLRGEAVSPERIDPGWLEYAAEFQLVKLDTFAIDLLHRRAELRALLKEAA